jgi:putative membrane protein
VRGSGRSVMIETILVVGIVIACTVWYMRKMWRQRARILTRQHSAELEVLGERYARGEINRDEYLQKRSDILGYPLVP